MSSIKFLVLGAALSACALAATASSPPPSPVDPLEPAASGGVEAVDRALARLSGHRRLLMIAAHPDDEDTFVLAHVARALGGEAAYLSLSRGDGGQNLIGSELGEALGLLRSRELEAARRVDGARQYFTRAFDFGYTRSLDETLERWPEEELMKDARRVARHFKPQVLVAIFPRDARAGHGQHQASAVVAEQLFAELLEEGRADALYRAAWWNPEDADLELDLGRLDPFSGRSTFQIALAGRSLHRCQDMGFEQPPGDATARLIWQGGRSEKPPEDLFGASDTRLAALAEPLRNVAGGEELFRSAAERLERVEDLAIATRQTLVPSRLGEAAPALAEAAGLLDAVLESLDAFAVGESDREALAVVRELVAEKRVIAQDGLFAAAGVVADAVTDRERVVPGETFEVRSLFWHSGGPDLPGKPDVLKLDAVELDGGSRAAGFRLVESAPAEPAPGRFQVRVTDERRLVVAVPEDAEPTVPYFLRRPREGDLYRWPESARDAWGRPFESPPVVVIFRGSLNGVPFEQRREVVHRYRDQRLGEVRRPLRVVPALEASLDRDLVVRRLEDSEPLELTVELVRRSDEPVRGALAVEVPWDRPRPEPVPFELAGPRNERVGLPLSLEMPRDLRPGRYEVALSLVGGDSDLSSLGLVDYEHIRPAVRPGQTRIRVHVGEIRLPRVRRVAYLRGASDRVPEALEALGLPLERVTAEELLTGDLDRFDAVVVGSRAFEVEPVLAEANPRLLDYARRGGTVVVQYQQYQFVSGGFSPFPLEIRRPHDRVTDETADVRLLVPEHPFFRTPNALTDDDWDGWVQERGLYFGGTWGDDWTPLLGMFDPVGDPGGEEKTGALLVADLGEGRYVYTGLSFFRQLPAGVVGAYRLFLNLLEPADRD